MRESFLVAQNTLIQSLGRVVSLAFSIVIIGLVTRYLGTEQFGYFTTITAYLFFFSVFAELGISILTSRELPLVTNISEYLSTVFSLKVVVSGILFILSAIIIWTTPYPLAVKIGVSISTAGYFTNSFVSIFTSFFQYRLATTSIATADVLNKIVVLLIVFAVWTLNLSLQGVVIAFTLGLIGQFVYLLHRLRQLVPISFVWNPSAWKTLLTKTWPFALSGILILFYFKADTLILSWYQSPSDVGIYGAAYRLLEVLLTFPALFAGLLLPLLSKSFEENNKERFQRIWQRSFDGISFIVVPILFFTLGAAEEILFYLTGAGFVPGAHVLRLLIIATGFIFFAHLTTFSVGALNIQKKMIPHYGIAAVGALLLYMLLIPPFSYYGAAVTTIIVECYIFISSFLLVRGSYQFHFSFRNSLTNFLNGLIVFTIFLFLKPISIFFATPVFGIMYLVLGFTTKTIDRSVVTEFINSGLNRLKSAAK